MSTPGTSDNAFDEIKNIFITECNDGLDVIETGLLELEGGSDEKETINDIFRGAHSIKGGAATFGYSNIAEFTHVLETVLDEVRSDQLNVTPELVKLFLESVDCLRNMVESMEDEEEHDTERAGKIVQDLNAWLKNDTQEEEPAAEVSETISDEGSDSVWEINFVPNSDFLKTGNQPQHIFRALAELGQVKLNVDTSNFPEFDKFEPDLLYVNWVIELVGDAVSEEKIRDVFDWVETQCDITLNNKSSKLESESNKKVEIEEYDRRQTTRRDDNTNRRAVEKKVVKKESSSIRVDIEKIDVLLNLVGEMVINQAMLSQLGRNKGKDDSKHELEQGLSLLERTTRELQEAVMEIRMLPVSVTFSRFPRLVYDLSSKLDKSVDLKITGEQTELDKTVLEKIGDPLLHLIRNSLDHGIESPEERREKGKPEKGEIHLSASHEGGSVVIRVTDDGAGLNTEKIRSKAIEKGLIDASSNLNDSQVNDLVFHPGFSTADVVTDVSGRGVGMDVVRSNIDDIGGRVEVQSQPGIGSTFQITLPLTLAILDGQLVKVADETYVLPLLSIVETVQVQKEKLNIISGKEVVYRLRGKAIPVIDMRTVCRIPNCKPLTSFENKQLIIVESDRKSIGLVVDGLLEQHQVVIKSLETNFSKVPGMLGATILGDGTVSLILDVTTLADLRGPARVNEVKH